MNFKDKSSIVYLKVVKGVDLKSSRHWETNCNYVWGGC